ncbi:MAG: hypothetical protein Q7J34_01890 [Bacteroidales bacterium]|nr:hypothetical protein [Bacteroidales bacterium]
MQNLLLHVFISESIENFVEGGKARVIVELKADGNLQSAFYLSMSDQELSCYDNNITHEKPKRQSTSF